MFIHILILLLGAAMILVGANYFTSGSVAVARRLGVSDFVIGLTLVALGSSAPDLAVGVLSALKGHTQFALGNVVGSCIFDGLLVVGCVALVHPIKLGGDMLRTQLPCLLVGYAVVMIAANAVGLNGAAVDVITRTDGMLMLIVFGMMLWQDFRKGAPGKPQPQPTPSQPASPKESWTAARAGLVALEVLGGLGALIWGGDLFVDGASGIALEAHVSEAVIGLTVVALGTSLPDLATSVVAAVRHRPGIAVGNVVGSCLFDALLVLGASSITAPLPLGGVTNLDLSVMAGSAVLLLVAALLNRQRAIGRWLGAGMIVLYALYIIHLVIVRT